MALASDLQGLGLPALLSLRMATGGNGPLTISAAGSAFSTATAIKTAQFVCSCTNADGTKAVALPTVGGDGGALLADDYVVNNAGTTSLQVFASTGVLISMAGSNGSQQKIQSHSTATFFPISTTQWVGVSGN